MNTPAERNVYLLQKDNTRMISIVELMREVASTEGEFQKRARALIRELDGK